MTNWKDIIATNNINEIRNLIDTGANVNEPDENGFTPVMIAANGQNPEILKTLIKAGADVGAIFKYGETPLMQAARGWCANPEIVKILLNAGADVNARDKNGKTPLMYAAEGLFVEPETVKLLLKAGRRAAVQKNIPAHPETVERPNEITEKEPWAERLKPAFDRLRSVTAKALEKLSAFSRLIKRKYAETIRPLYQRRKKTFLFGFVLLAILTGYGVHSYMNGYTATNVLNCRDEPGTYGQIIGKIAKGKRVSCSAFEGEWCQTRCGKEKGFVYKKYLSK